MNDLIKALEAASIDLGHLTEPPWCAYTHVVADVRNKVRAALPEFQSALARETKRAEENGKLAHDLGIQNAALSRQLAERQWQPIATAPTDGTLIDLWVDGSRLANCYRGQGLLNESWLCNGFPIHESNKITHWMPLPSDPI